MNKTYAKKTFKKNFVENRTEYTITATAEIHSISGQEPYFSLTGEIKERGVFVSGGCLHDDIRKHFPELSPFIRWHLVSMAQPLHYVANSLYWAGLSGWCDGKPDSPPNYEYLLDTCKWGTVEGDEQIDLHQYLGTGDKMIDAIKKADLTHLLNIRLEKVQDAFISAMRELFGDEIIVQK